jgi:hypothetical protein
MKYKKVKPSGPRLDAKTFQQQLDELANTIAFKVQREGPALGLKPSFVIPDIYYLLRQSHRTFDLFCFMNADDRREKDVDYRMAYSAVILPLVRTMIDCLYNITAILKNPGPNGYRFRESGLKQILNALDDDQNRYGGDPTWDIWIAQRREQIDLEMRRTGVTEEDVKTVKLWPTLSAYLRPKKNTPFTPHQEFLKKLTFGFWQEYSGISHATFQGLLPIAAFFVPNDFPHEWRPTVESKADELVSIHVPRAAAILLCTLTELQARFKFDGARINERLHQVWNPLLIVPEIKELYDERYAQLMRDKGINPM